MRDSMYDTIEELIAPKLDSLGRPIGDSWECPCGNTADAQGFYPANSKGQFVEPVNGEWDTNNYKCDRCGRIFNSDTGICVYPSVCPSP